MSSSFCTNPGTCLPQSATLVWGVTRQARSALHEAVTGDPCHCGSAPFGVSDPRASLPRSACENAGCVDLFMDVWTYAHKAMHTRFGDLEPTLPGAALAYLTTSTRSRLAELNRQQRVARGGVAKPLRTDGMVGRVAASFGNPWLTSVFRFLLGYVASPGRVSRGPQGGWPLDALTQRKNIWDGGTRQIGDPAARAELRADVDRCLATVRHEAGDGWLYDCLFLPLANRSGTTAVPDDAPAARPGPSSRDDAEAELHAAATAMLAEMVRRARAGVSPGIALREAIDAWLGDEECPEGWAKTRLDDLAVRRLAKSLIASSGRDQEAA
jgi:hypothetical protein